MLNWFKKNKSNDRKLLKSIFNTVYNSSTLTWNKIWGIINHEKGYTDPKLRLSAIYCGMSLYTSSTVGLPRVVYRMDNTSGKRLRRLGPFDHPSIRIFLFSANDDWSADDMVSTCVFDTLYYGNFYALRDYDSKGRTYKIHYIHPSRIPRSNIYLATGNEDLTFGGKAARGEKLYKILTGVRANNEKHEFMLVRAEDMVHVKNTVLDTDYHRGFGFYENAVKSLELYAASEDFGHKFYTRGIATQMFLTTENRVAPEVLKRLEAVFDEDPNAPLEDIFKTRILEQGLKPVHMGIPFQHLQFIETRAFSVEDVSRWLQIPPALLHSKMGTGGSQEDFNNQISLFIQFGLGPLLSRVGNQLRDQLVPAPYRQFYNFEFERIYLFRTVINEFSQALRNLFEIGVMDREQIAALLGMSIDLGDKNNRQRFVPTNLMTIEHAKLIEEKAGKANQVMDEELVRLSEENVRLKDSPMPSEVAAQMQPSEDDDDAEEHDEQDESPDEHNQDKRLRGAAQNAFNLTIEGLADYERKVLNQKKESRPDDYDKAVEEFYAEDGKFINLLREKLSPWNEVIQEVSNYNTTDDIISWWISNKGIDNVINCA